MRAASCDPSDDEANSATKKPLTVSVAVNTALPRVVVSDERRLSQLLTHGLSNAIKVRARRVWALFRYCRGAVFRRC
jgi:hypothetical protein